MDNAMAGHSGALTSRSGRSRLSARSASKQSEAAVSAVSDGTRVTALVEQEFNAIQRVRARRRRGACSRRHRARPCSHQLPRAHANATHPAPAPSARPPPPPPPPLSSARALSQIVSNAKKRRNGLHTVQLCGACAAGNVAKVHRMLRAQNVDVNRGDYDDRRPLHVAAAHGQLAVARTLLAMGADVNALDRHGRTPLHDAQRHGHDDTARMLLEAGGEIGSAELADELCDAAADGGAAHTLENLLRFGADVNAPSADARTALHMAAAAGHAENVRLLLAHRADVNAADRRGHTPLHDAFRCERAEVSRLLLGSGGHMGSFDGAFALNLAAARDDVATLRRLVEHGITVNSYDAGRRTPLHLAVSNAAVSACHFLLGERSLEVNAEDRLGHTALDDAERERGDEIEVVRSMLLAKGAARGSGRPYAAASVDHLEEARAEAQAAQLARTRETLASVRAVGEWVAAEAAGAKAARALLEEATRLERARGQVLNDEQPELWGRLKAYAAGRPERYRHVTSAVQPAIEQWREALADFAATLTAGLSRKVRRRRARRAARARTARLRARERRGVRGGRAGQVCARIGRLSNTGAARARGTGCPARAPR